MSRAENPSDSEQSADVTSSTVVYKRPLFTLAKEYNEIYITGSTPLCVYYKRACQLLLWQLSRYSILSSKKFLKEHSVNKNTGVMANRKRMLSEKSDAGAPFADGSRAKLSISKRQVSSVDQRRNGVVLYGTGKSVNRALYVLQDVYEYVKHFYIEAQRRFNRTEVRVRCRACDTRLADEIKQPSKHPRTEETCPDCDEATNQYLEDIVNRILDVDITTGTVRCRDDVYKYKLNTPPPASVERFSPLDCCDASVEVEQKDRLVSSIRILITVKRSR